MSDAAEFEFSFPSELSPSLFSSALPFVLDGSNGNSNGQYNSIISPTGSSFPSLSLHGGDSPTAWPPTLTEHIHPQPPSQPPDAQVRPQLASRPSKRLFEEDERSALNAFFNETLGEPSKLTDRTTSTSATAQEAGEQASKRRRSSAASQARGSKRPSPPMQSTSQRIEEEAVHTTSTSTPEADDDVDAEVDESVNVKEQEDGDYLAGGSQAGRKVPANAKKQSATAATQLPKSVTAASKRSNHIASEQRRRTTIKDNYKSLVDLLLAGEPSSGISLQGGDADDDEEAGTGKKAKPKGRGRGRKGQDGAGATKSVVLEKAADYLRWLERGNNELKQEIARLQGLTAR